MSSLTIQSIQIEASNPATNVETCLCCMQFAGNAKLSSNAKGTVSRTRYMWFSTVHWLLICKTLVCIVVLVRKNSLWFHISPRQKNLVASWWQI